MKKPKYRIAKMFWFSTSKECQEIEKALQKLRKKKAKSGQPFKRRT